MKYVDVVIVNWNSGDLLRECIFSFNNIELKHVGVNIIVVDNHSEDHSIENIESKYPLKLVRNATNTGFATACNQGAKLGSSEFILFLNPDTLLLKNSIEIPIDYINDHQQIGILGIQLCDEKGNVHRSCAYFPSVASFASGIFGIDRLFPKLGHFMNEWDHLDTRQVDQVMGAYFLIRRNVFDELYGFDEQFFVYFEEVDFALRAKHKGWQCYFLSDAQVIHIGEGTTHNVKVFRLYLSIYSRIKYIEKHFDFFQASIVAILTLLIEPITRVLFLLSQFKFNDAKSVLISYSLVYKELIKKRKRK